MKPRDAALPLAFLALVGSALLAPAAPLRPAAAPAPAAPGDFPAQWIHGADCGNEPEFQVHAYDEDLYILRQTPCADFEAPFLYLIFGRDRALLLDTGSSPQVDLEPVVSTIIDDWLALRGLPGIELVVGHTHSHGDHLRNDDEFVNRPNTTVVGLSFAEIVAFWGFQNWPQDQVTFDLGDRVLDVLATPGHAGDALSFYDARTQLLLTGDTIYPGRLYVFGARLSGQWDVFRDSIRRLAQLASRKPVSWILGCHIEMTNTPGKDYAYGTTYHPDEHVLQLPVSSLFELHQRLQGAPEAQVLVLDDFIVSPAF